MGITLEANTTARVESLLIKAFTKVRAARKLSVKRNLNCREVSIQGVPGRVGNRQAMSTFESIIKSQRKHSDHIDNLIYDKCNYQIVGMEKE